jgi:hypothetical protein
MVGDEINGQCYAYQNGKEEAYGDVYFALYDIVKKMY